MRATLLIAAALLLLLPQDIHAALLGPGDIAFIGFNTDNPDDFSFVTLTTIDPSSTVFFSDRTWNGSAYSGTEWTVEWFSGASAIAAGTVVSFTNLRDPPTQAVSHGLFSSFSGILDLQNSDEALWAYLGPDRDTPTAFLSVVSNELVGVTSIPTLTGTGLTAGVNTQMIDGDFDVLAYIGPRSGQSSFAEYLPIISNPLNWTVSNDVGSLVPFNSTAFTVSSTPVPEPSALVLAIGGLLTFGASKRRRRSV